MNFFYNGIESNYQMALDTTSRGDFMSNTLEEETEIVENLAASNANHCPNYDRRSKVAGNSKAIEKLNAKIDMILKAQRGMSTCVRNKTIKNVMLIKELRV